MSKAYSSPTARLLQNSRLFSLPKPLPTPQVFSIGPQKGSDTATKLYPTHQAIESPFPSRSVGEWGLKRQLPLRTTAKSNTPLRILAQDTNDHITDFASSGDYTMTLAKFQELGIPIVETLRRGASAPISVYENEDDSTDPASGQDRWKRTGPWLPSLSAEQVDAYLKEISHRRPQWFKYLAEHIADQKYEALRSERRQTGHDAPIQFQSLETQRDNIIKAADLKIQDSQDGDADEIMRAALKDAAELDAQIETQAQWRAAIIYLDNADRAAQQLSQSAQATFTARMADFPDDEEHRKECQQELDKAQNDQEELQHKAYTNILERFGKVHDASSEQSLEDHARGLVAGVKETLRQETERQNQEIREWTAQQRQACIPTDDEVREYERRLRKEFSIQGLNSELSVLLADFLDLPGMNSASTRNRKRQHAQSLARTRNLQAEIVDRGMPGEKPPPSTHRGAGLGYLRSNAYVQNHPMYGPQAQRAPVEARVLVPRRNARSPQASAKLGVAGFVATDSKNTTVPPRPNRPNMSREEIIDQPAATMDPDLVGGGKLHVRPDMAVVYSQGQVELQVTRPTIEALDVKTGGEHLDALLEKKKAALGGALEMPTLSNSDLGLSPRSRPYEKLGLGL